jgi:hypothetical protein
LIEPQQFEVNRVPEEAELPALRHLLQQTRKNIKTLDDKLREVRTKSTDTHRRQRDQIKEPQDTDLKLVTVNNWVDMRTTLQRQIHHLEGLLHPIRRCHTDIMHDIFAWTLQIEDSENTSNDGDHRFKCAASLSKVCRSWRDVALKTGCLWVNIRISFRLSPQDIEEFCKQMYPQFRSNLPNISIKHIQENKELLTKLQMCQLHSFNHIRRLEFYFETVQTVAEILDYQKHLPIPGCRVDELRMVSRSGAVGQSDISNVLYEFIRWFQTIASLEIVEFRHVGRELLLKAAIPTVKKLHIEGATFVDIDELNRAFPNLEHFFLQNAFNSWLSGKEIRWNRLHTFQIFTCDVFPWRLLRTPQITSYG